MELAIADLQRRYKPEKEAIEFNGIEKLSLWVTDCFG